MKKSGIINNRKEQLDTLINECKITAVGRGYTDLICPTEYIEKFIKGLLSLRIKIIYWGWWCKVTEGHIPCGMGGPKDRHGNNWWYSELMEDVEGLKTNEEILIFLLNDWKNDKNYKACYVPTFYLEVPESWENIQIKLK